ncbi:hypothetical protein PV327_001631 [Microctonus hyperodae]|uniref:Uncharacterized protein n=1 Tax=Microctonus hyperodae TaxID=165561 RepID=A0AA39FDV9_MICHY|nr:hypothetical protein PV327_001631 [Microctonus hyperodae]
MTLELRNLKRKRSNECLFCEKTGNLVKEPQPQSFITIEKAADRRKDDVSEKIKNNAEFTTMECTWHRGCMASYVSEEKIKRRETALKLQEDASSSNVEANDSDVAGSSKNIRESLSRPSEIDKQKKCLICGKLTRKKDKKLLLCSELSAAQNIFVTAHVKQDHVFTQISTCKQPEDLFAIEVRYHKHCYRDYLRLPRNSERPAGRPTCQIPPEILLGAFEKLYHKPIVSVLEISDDDGERVVKIMNEN